MPSHASSAENSSSAPPSPLGGAADPGALGDQRIPAVFDRVAAIHGARVAVRFGDTTLTYAELQARAGALAAALAARGIGPGDLVGIASTRRLELVVAVLGALQAGAGYVPFDLALPPDRLRFMAQDTRVKVLLGRCAAVAAAGVPEIAFDALPPPGPAAPTASISGESIAYVMYTSGTTGKPKGVVLPHRSVIRMLVDTDWLRMSEHTVTLHSSAFAFDTSIIDLFAALLHGGTVVIPPDGALSIEQLADAISSHGVNTLWLTSGLFHTIADLRPAVFERVEQVVVGGDVVSPVQVKKVMDACPGCLVINGYGPTESNVTNAYAIRREDVEGAHALPIGRAIPGTAVFVVDEHLQPVPAGQPGELCIGGRGLALGYHDRPELTAAKFVQAPWQPGLRLYRSGDLAVDPGDGVIRFLGRMDGQVKIRGFRVETVEVEAVIGAHEGVAQVVVSALIPPGQTDKVLVAWVVGKDDGATRAALSAWCEQRLPEWSRPLHWQFVATIPLNPNGKVDRERLPPPDWQAAAAVDSPPRGRHELTIAAHWAQLFGLPKVGAEANFFELGGHSLLAVRVFDAIAREFAVTLPIATLFQHPTVRTLAAKVAAAARTPTAIVASEPWDTSVVIHPGPGNGAQPVFIVGGFGGNLNNLYELGRALGRHRALIGFQTRGILGHSLHASIPVIAADHLHWLRRHQPRGPWFLAGYSGGALTAFEMARQLFAAGERVDALLLLDAFAPGFDPRLPLGRRARLRAEWQLLRHEGLPMLRERTAAWLENGPLRRPMAWLRRRRHPGMAQLERVEEAWLAAADAYRGGGYAGPATLFAAHPRSLYGRQALQKDPQLGWGAFVAAERLRVVRVPGDHLRMVLQPHAATLVEAIEREIALVPR
jgi:amino acid adenylation domain-containing protein